MPTTKYTYDQNVDYMALIDEAVRAGALAAAAR